MKDGNLRNLLQKHLPNFHWVTIESGFVSRGVPDLNGCTNGHDFWVECKKTKSWTVVVRPEQIAWIEKRIRYGGKVFIAVRRQNITKQNSADELWLLDGTAARPLRSAGLNVLPAHIILGRWPGGPAAWPWPAIAGLIKCDPKTP